MLFAAVVVLLHAQCLYLGTHQGPVNQVAAQYRERGIVAACLQITVDEPPGKPGVPVSLQIHEEEGNLACSIDPAQFRIEFDAIEQRDLVIDQRHVTKVKVAMALAHETIGRSFIDGVLLCFAQQMAPLFQGIETIGQYMCRQCGFDMFEVLPAPFEEGVTGSEWRVCIRALRPAMEVSNDSGHGIDVRGFQAMFACTGAEQAVLGEFTHLDGIFDGRSVTSKARLCPAAPDGDHFQVKFRRESPVQAQFLGAKMFSPGKRREIHEAEIDRLFDLVGVIPGKNHPGDMRFDDREVLDGMGVERRILQRPDQFIAAGLC